MCFVVFVFNGGLGLVSLWLYMGVFGFQCLVLFNVVDDGVVFYDIVENVYFIFDVVDLVFIDLVGIGWSWMLGEGEISDYWGVIEDVESLVIFICQWLVDYQCWNFFKYLLGESYGMLCIGVLLNELEGGYIDVVINGVVLIFIVVDFCYDDILLGNDVGYVGLMLGFVVIVWYYGKVDQSCWNGDLEVFLVDVCIFVIEEYMLVLLYGVWLDEVCCVCIVSELLDYIGLFE